MTTPDGSGNQGPTYPDPSPPQPGYPPPTQQPGYPPPPPPAPNSYPPGPSGYAPPPGPPSYGIPPQPPRRSSLRTAIVAIVALVIVVALIFGAYLFLSGGRGNVTELKVGDCIDEPVGTSSVSDVQHQPCTSAHDAEVIYVVTDTSASYPGADYFRTLANQVCVDQATLYLGTDFNARDDISGGFFYPQADSWSSGDHDVTCYVDRLDGAKLYASVKGIGTAPLATPH